MSIHQGHRERLRERFIRQGLNGYNELNALELLLFYAIPRKDTNPIAHALLERFGSLAAVFEATQQELEQIPGVGENAASLICLLPQMMRRAAVSKAENIHILKDTKTAGEYLRPKLLYEREEVVLLVCLDSRKRVINCVELSRGLANSVSVSVRKLVEFAVLERSDAIILAHNHPSGYAMPSIEDRNFTLQAKQALATVGISLADHFIVTDGECVSMAEMNFMP